MSFAVIETGGKQYLVEPGNVLKVEKLERPKKGNEIIFDKVLLMAGDDKDVKIGAPYVTGAKVTAKIDGEIKGKKVIVIKYKSKTRQFKKKGHRQTHTKITITGIKN